MLSRNGLSTWPTRPTVSVVPCGSSAWQKAAKGDRARRESRVRRLLPAPAVVARKPILLGSIRWVDVAGRTLRRVWTAHWRRQYVEVLPLAQTRPEAKPPPRPPRAVRSHHRWSWQDRLTRNAWWGPPQVRITVAGVPAFLTINAPSEELANTEAFSKICHLPSELIMRAKDFCLPAATSLSCFMLVTNARGNASSSQQTRMP
jgi:hypothetical protein